MAVEQSAPVWDPGLAAPSPRRRRDRRWPCAIAISALAHLALIGLAMWSVSEQVLHLPAGASGGEGGAVTVTLVGDPGTGGGGKTVPVQPKTGAALDAMFQRFHSTDPAPGNDQGASPKGGAAQLFKEIADARQTSAGRQRTSATPDGQGDTDGYDLWAKIRPCWRRASAIVVTLDVGIDSQGRLAWAPRPVRVSRSPPGPHELLAESMAVEAAVRCAPYRDAAPVVGAKSFRIVFAG